MTAPADLRATPYSIFYPEDSDTGWRDIFGCALPFHCGDAVAEYDALRGSCALMEYSMLYRWDVMGPGALDVVNSVVSRDLHKLGDGQIAYGVIVDEQAKMIDDVTVFRISDEHVKVIGGNFEANDPILRGAAPAAVTVSERRDETAQLSIQGPASREILQSMTSVDLSNESLAYYTFQTGIEIGGVEGQLNRMGFTAELGFEFICAIEDAPVFGRAILEAGASHGIRFAGLATMLPARLEAGMIMADLEYDHTSTPFETRLGWTIDFDKGPFRGRDALAAAKESAPDRVVSVVIDGVDDILFAPVFVDGEEVGVIPRAVPSPALGQTLGMARVRKVAAKVGTTLTGTTGDQPFTAVVVKTPVYDPERIRVRS